MRKCFENIARITFGDDLSMSEMTSAEGETVKFSEILYPRGNVENWLTDVDRVMMASVREFLKISIAAYPDMERTDWVLKWPGQVVIAGCQTYWAQEVEEAITSNNMVEYCEKVWIHRSGSLVRSDKFRADVFVDEAVRGSMKRFVLCWPIWSDW